MKMTNNEYGSDYHYCTREGMLLKDSLNAFSDESDFSFFFSGRAALFNLVKQEIMLEKAKQIFVPSYYCHEVVNYIRKLPIEIIYYNYNPFLDSSSVTSNIPDTSFAIIVNVSFFGLKLLDFSSFRNATIIEDLTHDILSFKNSTAKYCFGSLRKELPVPTGGFCYSPLKLHLPREASNLKADNIAAQKLLAMLLKEKYLEGTFKNKDIFRTLFTQAETGFDKSFTNAGLSDLSKYILFQLNIDAISAIKQNNLRLALKRLKSNSIRIFNLVKPDASFGLIIQSESKEKKEALKSFLIIEKIFPAILWPHQKLKRDIIAADKMLLIHLDYRHSEGDVIKITDKLNKYFDNE